MLLEKAGGLRVGEEVELQFDLPEVAPPMKLRAKTVRRDLPDRIAVAFQALSPDYRKAIRNYIAPRVEV